MSTLEMLHNKPSIGLKSRSIKKGPEFEMVNQFIEFILRSYTETESLKLAVFLEPKLNGSFPDIVFVEYDPNIFTTWDKNRNNLSVIDLKIIHFIIKYPQSTQDYIASSLNLDMKKLGKIILKLSNMGLLNIFDSQKLCANTAKIIGIKSIIAVEAKIGKWKEVLFQATLNKNFASESWALISSKGDVPIEIANNFERSSVGLYIYLDNKFKTVVSAKTQENMKSFESVLVNEWIGRTLNIN